MHAWVGSSACWGATDRSEAEETAEEVRLPVLLSRSCCSLPGRKLGIGVKRKRLMHNHETTERVAGRYPMNRIVPMDSRLIPDIKLMIETDARRSMIVSFIRDHSTDMVDTKDMRNLCQRIMSSGE